MLSELQKRKLTMLFRCHDRDGDGFLTRADYEGFAKRMCELWKYPPGSQEYETAYAQNVAVWDYVQEVADTNKDGKLSLDEHLAAYDNTLSDDRLFNRMVVEYGTSLMQMGDLDRDGKLSGAEFARFMGCYGVEHDAAQRAFRHLDADGSGYLSIGELIARGREFYGDDPAAPGNWLLGSQ